MHRAEKARAAVIGGQAIHVLVEFLAVEFALEKVYPGALGMDLRA